MELPRNEKSFLYSHKGEITGMDYNGSFKVKCILNMSDKRLIEIEKSAITADLSNPTDNLAAIAEVVANLRIRTLDAPSWFIDALRSLDLLDEEIYFELYGKCLEAQKEWMDTVKGESLGEQKAETPQAPQPETQNSPS